MPAWLVRFFAVGVWVGLGAITLVLTWIVAVFGPAPPILAGYLFPLGLLLLIGLLVVSTRSLRRRRAAAVLGYLEQAVNLNLPLPTMLSAAANGESGTTRKRLFRLAARLTAGRPVQQALEMSVPEASPRTVALIGSAEASGQLPAALARIVQENLEPDQPSQQRGAFYRAYALAMILSVASIVGMISIFVMPKYHRLLDDFELPIPAPTQAIMSLPDWAPAALIGLIALIIMGFVGVRLWEVFLPGWPAARYGRSLTDRLLWALTPTRVVERDRGLGDVFGVMADALEAHRPLDQALYEAEQLPVNLMLRRRIARWSGALSDGAAIADAARAARLPALAVGLLASAQATATVPQTLRYLSSYYALRFNRAREVLAAMIAPLTILFFAALVAAVALALFLPLIKMIDALSLDMGALR